MTDAKLISYTINDFSTEIEMESFLHLMEKHGDEFYKKLKKHGLIRWRVNQIWNKSVKIQCSNQIDDEFFSRPPLLMLKYQ